MKTTDTQLDSIKEEQFQDFIYRLFPDEFAKDLAPSITFQVTDDCCLNCTYCYQHKKGNHKLDFETAKKGIDKILSGDPSVTARIDSYNTNGVVFEFIGGEPFLEIELIDQITDYLVSEMIRLNHPWATKHVFSISTNGILYFDPRVQEYIKKHFWNLSLSISIDGNQQLHDACRKFPDGSGSYNRAIEAAKHYMKNYNGKIGSKMTLSPFNIQYTYEAIVGLIDQGYTKINCNCVYEEGWELQHATILYYELKKVIDYLFKHHLEDKIFISIIHNKTGEKHSNEENFCGSSAHMIAINHSGNFYPCLRFMEDSLNDKVESYVIGDVNNGIGQDEITKKRLQDLTAITWTSQSSEKCNNCLISQGCGWCTAYNYEKTGSVNKRVTFNCIMHQAEVLASSYFYNLFYSTRSIDRVFKLNIPEEWALEIISKEEFQFLRKVEEKNYGNSYNSIEIY